VDDFAQISRDFNASSAELLLTDLDVAMTFLDVAATTRDAETARRNRANARVAYNSVLGFLPKLTLTESERESLDVRLGMVKQRLLASGADL
jgi:hypothetical protein